MSVCGRCYGSGTVISTRYDDRHEVINVIVKCPRCGGAGDER
jgi:DnaJ-class molecular chaperone